MFLFLIILSLLFTNNQDELKNTLKSLEKLKIDKNEQLSKDQLSDKSLSLLELANKITSILEKNKYYMKAKESFEKDPENYKKNILKILAKQKSKNPENAKQINDIIKKFNDSYKLAIKTLNEKTDGQYKKVNTSNFKYKHKPQKYDVLTDLFELVSYSYKSRKNAGMFLK